MDGFKYTVQDVFTGCDELIRTLCAPGVEFTNKEYAITYLRAMRDAYAEYGIEGLRTQAAYVLCNLTNWRDPRGLGWKRAALTREWLRQLSKAGVIVP